MKLSNFEMLDCGTHKKAAVTVTTGMLWWKKTERREIAKKFGGYWFFTDTGEFTPGFRAETLARAWEAQHG